MVPPTGRTLVMAAHCEHHGDGVVPEAHCVGQVATTSVNMMVPHLFRVLVILVSIDIILTLVCVGILSAVEINPLASHFQAFMTLKIAVSVIGLFILSKMRNYPCWTLCVGILTIIYGFVLLFNLLGIAGSIV